MTTVGYFGLRLPSGMEVVDERYVPETHCVHPDTYLQLWTYNVAHNLAALRRAKRVDLWAGRSFKAQKGRA